MYLSHLELQVHTHTGELFTISKAKSSLKGFSYLSSIKLHVINFLSYLRQLGGV